MPKDRSLFTFVLGCFHCFHRHIRSLLRIHLSISRKRLGVSASEKYPHHPIKYWLSFWIRSSSFIAFFREVISRILAFTFSSDCLAILTLGSLSMLKLNPRNFRFHGRSTSLFASFTFSFSLVSMNRVTDALTRSPALRVFT
ncbi:hypothetical protein D3C75_828210 [compost metagenome]